MKNLLCIITLLFAFSCYDGTADMDNTGSISGTSHEPDTSNIYDEMGQTYGVINNPNENTTSSVGGGSIFSGGLYDILKRILITIDDSKITLEGVTRHSLNFSMDDGVEIFGTVYYPSVSHSRKCPVVIFAASWGTPKVEYETVCFRFAQQGYIVYSYVMRGWFRSNNNNAQIDMCGPRSMRDLGLIMDGFENHVEFENAVVDTSMGFTLIGISQGGLHAFTGAVSHPHRVNNIVVMSGVADIYDALYRHDTARSKSMKSLVNGSESSGNPDPIIRSMCQDALERKNLDFLIDYANIRSAAYRNNIKVLNDWDIPVYIMHNYDDAHFHPNHMLDFFNRLQGSKKRLDFSFGNHATYEAIGMLGFYPECWNNAIDWVNHFAQGRDSSILSAKVSFKNNSLNYTERFSTWPTTRIKEKSYYLSSNIRKYKILGKTYSYTVNRTMESTRDDAVAGSNLITHGDGGFDTASGKLEQMLLAHTVLDQPSLTRNLNYDHCVLYQSELLWKNIAVTGNPRVELWVKPLSRDIRLIAHLVSIDPTGLTMTLKSMMPYTMFDCEIGKPVKISFELTTIASKIPPGHRVGLLIDTYDPPFDNPYFSQSFKYEILYSNDYPSKLIVPYVDH